MDTETILAIRKAFLEIRATMEAMERRLYKLENDVSAHGCLLVDLRGKDAVDFHSSFDTHEKSDKK